MAVYFVLMHTITDLGRYKKEYIPAAVPFVTKHGGEAVALSFDAEPVQGNPPSACIVIRFPSAEAAHAFVDDPEYQPVKQLRLRLTTDANAVLVPEFKMPET